MQAIRMAPDRRLKQKVGESSPADDLRAIAELETGLDGFGNEFAAILEDWLRDMKACLDKPDNDCLDSLYARAHELRGMAGSFGYPELGQLANSLCRYLSARHGQHEVDDRLLHAHINAMQIMRHERLNNSADCTTMVQALEFAMRRGES